MCRHSSFKTKNTKTVAVIKNSQLWSILTQNLLIVALHNIYK